MVPAHMKEEKMSILNTKTVDEFVEAIRQSMEASTRSWIEIGQALAEARDMFGSGSDHWRQLLKATKFANSTAHKLASIATSERLQTYRAKLAVVHSWGTLYAIHALPDDKFEELKRTFRLDDPAAIPPVITLSQVERIKKGKTEKTNLRLFASISIDENALNGDLINGGDLERLKNALEEFRATVPYIRVVMTEVLDKSQNEYFRRLSQSTDSVRRKALERGISGALARRKRAKDEKVAAHESRCLGMSRAEIYAMYEEDPEAAFGHLGLEYNAAEFHSQAESEVGAWVSRFAKRATAAGNPYRYAAGAKPDQQSPSAGFEWMKQTGALQLQRVRSAANAASEDAEDTDEHQAAA